MDSELKKVRAQLKALILTNCNTIWCKDCLFKWPKDKEGNSCRSDYLVSEELKLESESINKMR